MEVIILLIAFSLLVALLFLGLFFWAVKSGQFDDSDTPAQRILLDEEKSFSFKKNTSKTKTET